MNPNISLGRFLGLVLLLLIPSFFVWMLIDSWLAWPAVWLSDVVFRFWMPDVVATIQLQGSNALVMTHFGELKNVIVSAEQAGYQMGFPADVRLLSYSIPFYAALHFSTPQSESLGNFSIGLWVLLVLIFLGLISVTLKNLMLGLGQPFFDQAAVFLPNGQLIAIFYQLSILIVPPLAPIIIWAWQSRNKPLMMQFSTLHNSG
ncbi:MAG: exosortase H-associated membrane protein [Halioglobus sp.]